MATNRKALRQKRHQKKKGYVSAMKINQSQSGGNVQLATGLTKTLKGFNMNNPGYKPGVK